MRDFFTRHKKIKYAVFAVTVLLLVAIVFLFTGKKRSKGENERIPAVVIQKPFMGTVLESITLSGYVEASAMIPVVPFVQGTITEYYARAGDYVEKDTVLAKIDDAPFRQQLLQAEAAYFAAKSTFERLESLFKSGAATQQNYDSAKAQHDAMKAQYDLARLQYDYTEVKASIDGTILIADLAEGSIGTQTQPVAVLADLGNQVVRLKVPEKYFDLFTLQKDDLVVTVTRPAEKNMYSDAVTGATIENIAPYVSPESKNFQVVCRLDEPGERFRPGMYVKINVAYAAHHSVPLLPVTAKKLDGSCYTFSAEDSTVHFVQLEETPSDAEHFMVPAEYAESFFVVDGHNTVFDGQRVSVIKELEPYAEDNAHGKEAATDGLSHDDDSASPSDTPADGIRISGEPVGEFE